MLVVFIKASAVFLAVSFILYLPLIATHDCALTINHMTPGLLGFLSQLEEGEGRGFQELCQKSQVSLAKLSFTSPFNLLNKL